MDQEQQLYKNLELHIIYGAPYFIREEREGVFRIVNKTSTSFKNGHNYLITGLDANLPELFLNEDIVEFCPGNNALGFLAICDDKYDFRVIRGLRHLARLEKALYPHFDSWVDSKI